MDQRRGGGPGGVIGRDLAIVIVEDDMGDAEQQREDMAVQPIGHDPFAARQQAQASFHAEPGALGRIGGDDRERRVRAVPAAGERALHGDLGGCG